MRITDGPFIREKEKCLSIELGTIENDYYVALNGDVLMRNNEANAKILYEYLKDKMNDIVKHINDLSAPPLYDR